MADDEIPIQVDCLLIPRRHGSGWTIDVKIDGETITGVYTDGSTPDRQKVIQDALHSVRGVIRSLRNL
jgi:hypothetical protein